MTIFKNEIYHRGPTVNAHTCNKVINKFIPCTTQYTVVVMIPFL